LFADGDFCEMRPNFGIEAVAIHAAITRCITQSNYSLFHFSAPSGTLFGDPGIIGFQMWRRKMGKK